MVVGDYQVDTGEAAAFEPGEEGHPAPLRLTIAQLQTQDLPVAVLVDSHPY
jgi:hypothetical protein